MGSASLIPSYTWFDGTSEVMYLGESLVDVPTVPLDADIATKFAGTPEPLTKFIGGGFAASARR